MKRKIPWRKKLNPLWWCGNEDDPEPPEWFEPTGLDHERRNRWRMRNPGHNLMWYVFGVADQEFRRYGIAPDNVFTPHGRWNVTIILRRRFPAGLVFLLALALSDLPAAADAAVAAVTVLYGLLPFVSYRGRKWKWYVGWRERGALGGKVARV